ncbi:MAG: amidohydrolase [Anaerolineae bacterium]|nr:amidohydrolase [Anaerolineae bacterium]
MADVVLYNGRFYTLDSSIPRASALAIRDDRIIYVGDDRTARALLTPHSEAIDVRGACGVPGLTDAHMHLQHYAEALTRVDAETPTVEETLHRVAERAARIPKGAWVLGRGWNHNVWGGQFPTAAQLDFVAPDHPVCLGAKSGHAVWVNSRALQVAGIGAQAPDPPGGQIVRDDRGCPTGILLEAAMALVHRHIPEAGLNETVAAMREAIQKANHAGLTGLHDMDGGLALQAEQVLRERGELTIRIFKSIPRERLEDALALGLRSGFGDDWLRIGQVKMFADGALGPRTAWMLTGYETAPNDTGIPTTPIEALRESVMQANRAGLGCAIHAIGDRACREVLDIYEAVGPGTCRLRNRIEHAQILHPDDMPRFGKLGVIASMQPIHATSDMDISDLHLGQRAAGAYPFGTLLQQGAVLAFGSDCPVEVIDPLIGLHAAVTRRRADGRPGEEGWYGQQRLSVEQAVCGFTWGAAFAAGLEDRLGTLRVGKWADITLLGEDVFAVAPMEIPSIEVLATLVGGHFVWRSPNL